MANKKELEEKKVKELNETKKEEKAKETELDNKDKEKIKKIIAEAKKNGKMSVSDLATKLNDVNPEKRDDWQEVQNYVKSN